jgi:penicillin amidase
MRRLILALLLLVALAGVAGGSWAVYVWRRALPEVNGTVEGSGVAAPVEIVRDRWGVPHIFAASDEDAYFALGWAMAQDRLFQMDLVRHVSQGRLAELFGAPVVEIDTLFRTLDLPGIGRRMYAAAAPKVQAACEAFARGINAYQAAQGGRLPPEYALLQLEPRPFAAEDFSAMVGFMTWGLNPAWQMDPIFEAIVARVGPRRAAALFPQARGGLPAVYPARTAISQAQRDGPPPRSALSPRERALLSLLPGLGGSNSWVVGPEKSATGRPILANDPHLGHGLPPTWYLAHLRSPGQDVAGALLPGVPFVVIGHNRSIAWGLTNLMSDGGDFFLEKLDAARPGMVMYRGGWVPLEVRREVIHVKDGAPVQLEVRRTPHGPLVNHLLPGEERPLSYQWVYDKAGDANELEGFHALNRARDWDAFRAALARFGAAAQNVTYADRRGHIGQQAAGRLPRVGPRGGMGYRIGWDGSAEWEGFLPFARNPSSFDPPEGFVASANNPTWPPSAPFYVSGYWEPPDRYLRIVERLREHPRWSREEMARLQADTLWMSAAPLAAELLAAFAAAPPPQPIDAAALALLEGWRGEMDADSAPAAVFAVFYKHLFHEVFDDELGTETTDALRVKGNFSGPMLRAVLSGAAEGWLDRADTAPREGRADILRAAFRKAVRELERRLGDKPAEWRWGRLHRLTLRHPLGRSFPLSVLFNLGPFPLGGHAETVAKAQFTDDDYAVYWGPSLRMVTELGHPERALAVLPGGQSGIPASAHYDDLAGLWRTGRMHPLLMEREDIAPLAEGRLMLLP